MAWGLLDRRHHPSPGAQAMSQRPADTKRARTHDLTPHGYVSFLFSSSRFGHRGNFLLIDYHANLTMMSQSAAIL